VTDTSLGLPRETARSRVDATLGMVFFIGSWSMAFGTLFLSFGILRQRVGVWPPPGIHLPSLPLAAAGTVVRHVRAGHRAFARTWLAAMGLGLVFAGLQAGLWFDLLANGRQPESGVYESLFYGLTWVHAAHVATGLLALAFMLVGIVRGRYGSHRMAAAQNAALFWHFVDVVWVILFVAFFFT